MAPTPPDITSNDLDVGTPPPGLPGRDERAGTEMRRPRRSGAWLAIGSIIVLPMLAWSGFDAVLQVAHEEETVTEVVDGGGISTVVISNPTGRVEVVGADVDDVTIRAEVHQGLRRTGFGHELDGDRLEVRATCPLVGSSWCEVGYRIEVPRTMGVEIRSADAAEVRDIDGAVDVDLSNGSLRASGLGGPADLRSTNGDVLLEGQRGGEIVAITTNGEVTVGLEQLPRNVEVRSTNGDATVLVPRNDTVRYAVTVESRNGTRTNSVITDPNSTRMISVTTTNGDATVEYR